MPGRGRKIPSPFKEGDMEPGTRFCPNHPDLRFPPFAQECTVCNHPVWIHPIPEHFIPTTTEETEAIAKAPEIIETLEEPSPKPKKKGKK